MGARCQSLNVRDRLNVSGMAADDSSGLSRFNGFAGKCLEVVRVRSRLRMRLVEPPLRSIRHWLDWFPDKRGGMITAYGTGAIGTATFSMLFTQRPSFPAQQRQFKKRVWPL